MLAIASDSRGGLPGLLDALSEMHARGEVGVLGIVLATEGSTYQKPGALVLLGVSGMIHGAISGGCLEPELEDRAHEVHRTGHAATVEFDTRSDEDLIFGSGTGCRGRIRLLLLPQGAGAPLTQALKSLVTECGVLELGVSLQSGRAGCGHAALGSSRWSWGTDGRTAGPLHDNATVEISVRAPPRILLLGAGPETLTLSLFARRLGWLLQVIEHRGRWIEFARAAGVGEIIGLPPDEAAEVWQQQHADAAIAMTHNYALDLQHLALCAASGLSYVGLLGPVARRDALLADLGMELTARLQDRLHAPVGLALGGRGPEPLALAVVAELQQHFANERRSFAKRGLQEALPNPSPSLTRRAIALRLQKARES